MPDYGAGRLLHEHAAEAMRPAGVRQRTLATAPAGGGREVWLEGRVGPLHARYRLTLERRRETDFWAGLTSRMLDAAGRAAASVPGTRRGARSSPAAGPLRTVRETFAISGLPAALDGLTIAHLSDLYADRAGDGLRAAARSLQTGRFDLCVFTGDFCAGSDRRSVDRAMRAVAGLVESVNAPCLAVLGDRDSLRMVPVLEALGLRVLLNEAVAVEYGGSRLFVAGVDDPHYFKADDVQAALQGIPAGTRRILLAHSPEIVPRAQAAGFDLVLCGHTRGRWPGLAGTLPLPRRTHVPHSLCRGAWRVGTVQGYTSTGCGGRGEPGSRRRAPEIAFHTLRRP